MSSKTKYENNGSRIDNNGVKSQHSESISFGNRSDNVKINFSNEMKQSKDGLNVTPFDASISKSGNLVEGEVSGSYGNLSGSGDIKVGSAAVSGEIKSTLYEDGKFSPSLGGSAKVEATAIDASIQGKYGNDDYNANVKGNVKVGTGDAEVSGSIGKIKYKDKATDQEVEAWGAQGKVGAEAYAVKGSIAGGVTIAGIKFNMSLEGKAGGIGASAEGRVTVGQIGGSLSIGALFGVGVGVSIDWSNANIPFIKEILNNKSNGGNTTNKNSTGESGGVVLGKAVFDIKPKVVKADAENFNKAAKKLKQKYTRIDSIKNHLEITGISALRIKKILSDINFDINDERSKLENLSSKLINIVQLYTDTENSIISDTK